MTRIISSTEAPTKNLAILLWGPAASHKTETPLRYFPNPLVLDVEGKAHHAIGVEGVQDFLMQQTKDVYDILATLDELGENKITFPDGSPIETVSIDSGSVLWSVRQEAGSIMAEERAARYRRGNVDPDAVTMTMLDWTRVKRPLKRLMTKLNNSPVKYFFVIAREKPLYEEIKKAGGGTELQRIGETPDIQRGVEYEVDVAFRFFPGPPWKCQVTRTRGRLEEIMPIGTEFNEFPYQTLIDYATGIGAEQQDEIDVAAAQADRERTRTKSDLVQYGRDRGLEPADVAEALKSKDLKFDSKKWDEMKAAVDEFSASEK